MNFAMHSKNDTAHRGHDTARHRAQVEMYCDFDGTITACDVTDRLLEELADPRWKEIEAAWENGEIGSRECMAQQVPLLRGGWKAIERVLDSVELEPSFKSFVAWCKDKHIPLHIVSDGLDKVIHHLLKREGIQTDSVVANRLVESTDGQFSLQFPYSLADAFCTSGVCKCKILADTKPSDSIKSSGSSIASNLLSRIGLQRPTSQSAAVNKTTRIVIGDGRSDFCWANEADLVFAKSHLLTYCKEKQLRHVVFEDFDCVVNYVESHLLSAPANALHPVAAASNVTALPSFGGLQPVA